MIRSFKDRETEKIFLDQYSKSFPVEIQKRAKACLDRLNAAFIPKDLMAHRSHRLEKLKGKRKGQYSIRVNKQYRISFAWIDRYAINVELTDYH